MKKNHHLHFGKTRISALLLVLCLLFSAAFPVTALGAGETLAGASPTAQGDCTLTYVSEPSCSGSGSLLVSNRGAFWHGAKWNVAAALTQPGTYLFTAFVRGDMDSVGQSLSYGLNAGAAKWYTVADCVLSAEEWTKLSGTVELTQAELDAVSAAGFADLYPSSNPGQTGNYYIDAVSFEQITYDDMSVCGVEPYGQAATLSRAREPGCVGSDVLQAAAREAVYGGAAWSIPAANLSELKKNTAWTLSMQVRAAAGSMSLTYNLEFWYNDGTPNNYLGAAATIHDAGWTTLSGNWQVPGEYLTDALERIVLYPVSGEGELGDYYLDAVSLTGVPGVTYDDMRVGGSSYFVHGDGTLTRDTAMYYAGSDSLLSAGRTLPYSGAGWDVKNLLEGGGVGTWRFSAYVRTVDSNQHLTYNIYLRYTDGRENWLRCGEVYMNSSGWSCITGLAYSTTDMAMSFEGLEQATLYPCTDDGQLGAYYIDAPSLTRTGEAVPVAPRPAAPTYDLDYFPRDGSFESGLHAGQVGYVFEHGAPVSLSITSDESYDGEHALLVQNRSLAYAGAGYDVTSYLKNQGWGNWFFHAYAKAVDEPLSLHYCIYLLFEDGTEDWLQPATRYWITAADWCPVNTDFNGGDAPLSSATGAEHDFSKLKNATLYPCTADTELGSYYLDDVKLYKGAADYTAPTFRFDSFPLDGTFEEDLNLGAPGHIFVHGEGATLTRTDEDANSGSYCLKVTDKQSSYSGAAWNVTDYLKQEGWGDWYFSCYAKSACGEVMFLQYSIYMQFSDGSERWLNCGLNNAMSDKAWMQMNTDTAGNPALFRPDDGSTYLDFNELTYAVLYPNLDTGEGDYYIDDARLWREEPAGDSEVTPIIIAPPENSSVQKPPVSEKAAPAAWLWIVCGGVGVLAAAAAVVFLLKKRKKNA